MSGPLKFIRQKTILMYTFKGQCAWCRRPVCNSRRLINKEPDYGIESLPFQATCDHWVVKSKGGSDRTNNMILACQECNQERGDKDFDVWHKEMCRRGLNPLSKSKMRRKVQFGGIIHKYMGSRNMPLHQIDRAVAELRARYHKFQA